MAQLQEPFVTDQMAAADLDDDAAPASGKPGLLWPIALSVLAHAIALAFLLRASPAFPPIAMSPEPGNIRISLAPRIAPSATEPPPAQESTAEIVQQAAESAVPTRVIAAPPASETGDPNLPPILSDARTERDSQQASAYPSLQIPDAAALRAAVNSSVNQQRERTLALDCDTLQQRNPLLDCAAPDNPGFGVLSSNTFADLFASRTAQAPLDTVTDYTDSRQSARALRMIDTVNRTFVTRDRVMGIMP